VSSKLRTLIAVLALGTMMLFVVVSVMNGISENRARRRLPSDRGALADHGTPAQLGRPLREEGRTRALAAELKQSNESGEARLRALLEWTEPKDLRSAADAPRTNGHSAVRIPDDLSAPKQESRRRWRRSAKEISHGSPEEDRDRDLYPDLDAIAALVPDSKVESQDSPVEPESDAPVEPDSNSTEAGLDSAAERPEPALRPSADR
jgi:hypothetical protein